MSSVPPEQATPDNGAIRDAREHASRLEADLKARNSELAAEKAARETADAKLLEIERAKLANEDRLTLERDDARRVAEEMVGYKAKVEASETRAQVRLDAELAKLTPEQRVLADKLLGYGPVASDKLDIFFELQATLVPATPAPRQVGTPTSPTMPGVVTVTAQPTPPLDPKDYGTIDWMGELKKAAVANPTMITPVAQPTNTE